MALLSLPAASWADWINLTGAETAENIAEFTVTDGEVRVAFELYPSDAEVLLPGDGIALQIEADGVTLVPEILLQEGRDRVDRFSPFAGMVDPRTRRKIPGPPEDKAVIFLDVRYPFDGRPENLTITPPMNDAGFATATIGFLLYHKAAPVVDFRYLSRPETLNLDWDDPWYTAFENPNLVRHHRWPQMTFLYVEPRELRHESLVRVRDLMEWTEDSPDVQRTLTEAEQSELKQTAGEFFRDRNPVTIDGEPAERSDVRAEFLTITTRGLQVVDSGAGVDASAGLIGVSESYWIESLPQAASMEWQLFDERIDQVPTNVIDPAGPYPSFIGEDNPVLEWENFLNDWREPTLRPIPVSDGSWFDMSSLRMTFTGTPGEERAGLIVYELLRQHAIAFLERDPGRRETALALVVADPQRDGITAELGRIFAVPTTGGGVAGITALGDVAIEELTSSTIGDGFQVRASWTARVRGQHWGHVDQRVIRFRALFDIVDVDDTWKLLDLTVLEANQDGG